MDNHDNVSGVLNLFVKIFLFSSFSSFLFCEQEKLSGTPDGLSLRELNDILSKWNLNPSGDMLSLIKSQAVLRNVQESIVASRVGGELINSRVEQSENSDNKVDPQDYVFVLFGSSFGFDHWCSTKVTGKVGPADAPQRRTMSSVDTAFMALNSDVAGDVIADRISLMVSKRDTFTTKKLSESFSSSRSSPNQLRRRNLLTAMLLILLLCRTLSEEQFLARFAVLQVFLKTRGLLSLKFAKTTL